MGILNRKLHIYVLLLIYIFSFLLNQVFFIDFKKVFAENSLSLTNLVAVVVDRDVYDQNQADIKWYASEYVQKNVSNSKAVVLPVDTKTLKSRDILKVLENMYFDGVKGETSKLEGLILLGDIPLPVVDNHGYIFPTIYPYVDFENQKYVFNKKSNFFVVNSDDVGQAEVWHGWIKFNDNSDYGKFFERLRKYQENPSEYVLPRMWYDDFLSLKKNFLSDSLPYYQNTFLFAEDTSYHRYTNLFSDLLKSDYSDDTMGISKDLADSLKGSDDTDLKEYADNLSKLSDESKGLVEQFIEKETPTLLLKEGIGNFTKSYDELISTRYLSKVRDNLDNAARWYRTNSSGDVVSSIEGHYEKVTKQDSWLLGDDNVRSVFLELNDFLEKKVNEQTTKEKYYLDVPVIVSYNEYQNKNKNYIVTKYCEKEQDDTYYNYYFGKNALYVTGVADTSIFNGTFLNYSNLEGKEVNFDPKKSIAGSYGIFSQQTESNRGYNIFNIESELKYWEDNKIPEKREKACVDHFKIIINLFCKRKGYTIDKTDPKEDPTYFAIRNRGGASPINLDDKFELKDYNYKNAWLPVSDFGGTKKIKEEKSDAYSYLGANSFGTMILVEDRYGEMNYPKYLDGKLQSINKITLPSSSFSIFDHYKGEGGVAKVFNLNSTGIIIKGVTPVTRKFDIGKLAGPCSDYPAAKIYNYKTISSIKYNTSPNVDQVSGMNLTTFDRPVDSIRNITFKGIGGGLVKFEYPNVFQVQVYNSLDGNLVIKSTGEISTSIADYFNKQINKYNIQLKSQSSQKTTYYNTYKLALDFLGQSDSLANPNRSYTEFSDKFFEDALVEFFDILVAKYGYEKIYGENVIKTNQDKKNFLSRLLYGLNKNVYSKKIDSTVSGDIAQIRENFDVNSRIAATVKEYLKKDDQGIFLTPDYNKTGYEVAYLNSDGDNYLSSITIPSFIKQLNDAKDKNDVAPAKKPFAALNFPYKDTQDCGVDKMGTVLLFDIKTLSSPWFEAMKCRLKKVSWPKITFNFNNSLGPIFVPGGEKNFWKDSSVQWENLGVKGTVQQYSEEVQKTFESFDGKNKSGFLSDSNADGVNTKLIKIESYVDIDLGKNSRYVDDANTKKLRISSSSDLGKLDITISLSGDNCFGLKGSSNNLCQEKVIFSSNVFEKEKEFTVDIKDKKSGFDFLKLKICLPYSNNCVEKQKIINLYPGTVSEIIFNSPTKRVIPDADLPFQVLAKDKYDNLIGQTLKNFTISVGSGEGAFYYNEAWANNITFQSFRNANFIFKAPRELNKPIVNITVSGYNDDNVLIEQKFPVSIVKGKLDISYEGGLVSNNSKVIYDLAKKGNNISSKDAKGFEKVNSDNLFKLSLRLYDQNGIYLDSVANAFSQNGLFIPGIKITEDITSAGNKGLQDSFIPQDSFIFSGGKLDILMYPTFKAGKDKITIKIPGFDDIALDVTVLAGKEKRISVDIIRTNIILGSNQEITGMIKIFDERGNLLDRNVPVKLGTMGATKIVGDSEISVYGNHQFKLKDIGVPGESYFYAIFKNVSLDTQVPGYQRIVVQDDILPKEKLNVMYLNLFGSDRGNQWGYFSDKNKYINDIMGKSEKTLAVTTQLIDDKKLKSTKLIVDQSVQINNIDDVDSSLVFQTGSMYYSFQDIGYLNIGRKSDFNFSSKLIDSISSGQEDKGFLSSLFGGSNKQSESKASFQEQQLSYIQDTIKNGKNNIIYFPYAADSIIKTNVLDNGNIIINGNMVVNFTDSNISNNVKIVLSENKIGSYSVFDVILGSKVVGQIFLWRNDTFVLKFEGTSKIYDSFRYELKDIFADGSTNGKRGVGIIDSQSSMDNKNISIESSNDDDLGIGFKASFKNITLFGQGKSVGQSTLPFGSEFLINFGDPVLKRISDNVKVDKTSFDAGIGQTIFSDTNKPIFKTLPIDFNNDGLKDILVVYKDGSIKLLKNYGGKNFSHNLQDLLMIEGGSKDVFVGDVDGNNYQDIIVWNSKNSMTVYKNNVGIFDVDGKLVCLNTSVEKGNITDSPYDLSDISQIFVKDMDKDGNIDIVTNDYNGDVKVFYGGSDGKGNGTYLSLLDYSCDSQRYSRQRTSEVLVKSYGVYIQSNQYLQDQSLVRRNGFDPYPEVEQQDNEVNDDINDNSDYDVQTPFSKLSKKDLKELKKQVKTLLPSTVSKIDDYVKELPEKLDPDSLGDFYVQSPIEYVPKGETKSSDKELYYIPIKHLSGSDKIGVYKEYKDVNGGSLKKGDEVLIKVTLFAKQSANFIYFEDLKGPWIVPTDADRKVKTFYFGNGVDSSNIIVNRDIEPYQFMLDNLYLAGGSSLEFYYKVYYDQKNTPVVIDVKDVTLTDKGLKKDGYNDILVNSYDPCLKGRYVYHTTSRQFSELFDDVQQKVSDYLKEMDKNQSETLSTSISDVKNVDSIDGVNKLIDSYGGVKEKWNFKGILQGMMQEGGLTEAFDMKFMDKTVDKVSDGIDKALDGLCKGFMLGKGGCSGMPIPFNQAFLSPGKYHLFGCFNLPLTPLDRGLPVLAFPTNGAIPIPPIWPPNPSGAGGIFGGNTSQFRLYISPTLTLGLGFAICLGPYGVGSRIPKPFRDIVGNCIVFALPPLSGKCKSTTKTVANKGSLPTESYEDYLVDLGDNGACNKNEIYKGESDSKNGKIQTSESVFKLASNTESSVRTFEGNFGGFLTFDQEPYSFVQKDSDVSFDSEDYTYGEKGFVLKASEKFTLKILGGKIKGLVKCIVQDRETRQIKYIVNNLTKMNVNITLPDFSDIVDGLSNLDISNTKEVFKEIKKEKKEAGYTKDLQWTGINNYFSQQALTNLSNSFDNPFETILNIFDKVPLVNINTKDINIKIPILTTDQLSSYTSYLNLRLQKNQKILKRREEVAYKKLEECTKKGNIINQEKLKNMTPDELSKAMGDNKSEDCVKVGLFINDFITFNQDSAKLIYVVKQNINVLEEYKKFPFKLYEWIHITDRYLAEATSFLSNFFGKLIYWLNTNSTRFAQYIDSLTILIHAIKTWQIIIDFSVNRSEKCSKCTNDNYSSYSCSLSFLCPKLPILPIPPFKIPNISLDFSHLDLGLDILLPQFQFSPMKISLPKIPDLPEPPEYQINLDILAILNIPDLPSIPVLPSPPDLPELPSFIPNVEVELPVLPPAPKIPNISPKIEAIIKVAEFIGKIFCIVKGGIGLVGEKGVKARIEQMTQRTWNVPIFDYFDLTTKYKDPPLRGFDWKLDAYLELRYNFDGVYNFMDSAASYINNFTNEVQDTTAEYIKSKEGDLNDNKVTDTIQKIQNGGDIKIKGSYVPKYQKEPDYVDYESFYSILKKGINYFKLYSKNDKNLSDNLDKLSYNMSQKSQISVNTKNIEKIKSDTDNILAQKKIEYEKLSNKILNDYDGFVLDLEKNKQLISDKNNTVKFDTSLISVDSFSRDLLEKQESPTKTYLAVNSYFVDGYISALKNDGPDKLNMTQDTYDKSKIYLQNLKQKIDNTMSTNTDLYAANTTSTCTTCSTSNMKLAANTSSESSAKTASAQYQEDISIYTRGVFEEVEGDGQINKIKIMQSQEQTEKIGDNYYREDINNDNKEDVIMWDDNSIYVKYFDQDDTYYSKSGKGASSNSSKYYLYSSTNGKSLFDANNIGPDLYADFNGLKVKIFDQTFEVKNFVMKGQSFENLKFDFTNSIYLGENVDGYVIKLNKRIDTFFDKYRNSIDDKLLQKKYIIVLPKDKYLATGLIVSFGDINKKPLKDLLTGTVLGIKYFDLDQDTISVVLNEVDRSWQYAEISTLKIDEDGLGLFTSDKYSLLKQASPWSNQILGGRQIISDNKGPSSIIYVYRPSIKTVISTGNFHELYVNTLYDLNIKWTDDVAISNMWISKGGKIIKELASNSKEATITLNGLSFTGADSVKFTVGAQDFQGNVSEEEVELSVMIPDINIINVDKLDSQSIRIISEISHDLDRGIVSFEKMINNIWRFMKGTTSNSFGGHDLKPLQTRIVGEVFKMSDLIGFFGSDGEKILRVNPTNGEISIQPNYTTLFELKTSFVNNFLGVSLYDSRKNQSVSQIKLPPQELISIYPYQSKPLYDLIKLPGTNFGIFSDGYCLKNSNQDCVVYVSLSGHVYAPSNFSNDFVGKYGFDMTGQFVKYNIKDLFGKDLLDVSVKIKSFEK